MHFAFRDVFLLCLWTYFISFCSSLDAPVNASIEKTAEPIVIQETVNIPDENVTIAPENVPPPAIERSPEVEEVNEPQRSRDDLPPDTIESTSPSKTHVDLNADVNKPSADPQQADLHEVPLESDTSKIVTKLSDSEEQERENDTILSKPTPLEEGHTAHENEEIPTFKEFQRKVEEENAKQRLIRQQQLNIAKHHDSTTKLPTLPMKGTSSSSNSGSPPPSKLEEEESSRKAGNVNSAEKSDAQNPTMAKGDHSASSNGKDSSVPSNNSPSLGSESSAPETVGKLPSIIELSNGQKRVVVVNPDDTMKGNPDPASLNTGSSNGKHAESKSAQGANEVRERTVTHNGNRVEESTGVDNQSPPPAPTSDPNSADGGRTDANQVKPSDDSSKSQKSTQETGKVDNNGAATASENLETQQVSPSEAESKGQSAKSSSSSGVSEEANSNMPLTTIKPAQQPHPKTNVASRSCGAKLLEVSDSMENSQALLNNNPDEYMNQPCAGEKWFVLETCEAVQIRTIQIANFEFFSSRLKTFHVYTSDRYPVKKWELLGVFQALDEKGAQLFEVRDDKFVKYLKFEFLDHYGNEHYCPMSMVGVYGTLSDYIEDDHIPGTNVEDPDEGGSAANILSQEDESSLKTDKEVEPKQLSNEGTENEEASGNTGTTHTPSREGQVDQSSRTTASEHDEGSATTNGTVGLASNVSNETDALSKNGVADSGKVSTSASDQNSTQMHQVDQKGNISTQPSEKVKPPSKDLESVNNVDKVTPVTPKVVQEDHVEGLFKKATDLIRNVAAGFKSQTSTEDNRPVKETKDETPAVPASPSNDSSVVQHPETEPTNCTSKINMTEIAPLWDRLVSCGSLISSYRIKLPSSWIKKDTKTDLQLSQIILSLTPLRAYGICQYVRVMKGWSVEEFICIVDHIQQLQGHNHTIVFPDMSHAEEGDRSSPAALSLEEGLEEESEDSTTSSQQTSSSKTPTSQTARDEGRSQGTLPSSSPNSAVNSNSQKPSKVNGAGSNVQQMPPLKKDIIYMRLSNRMVALEQKVNVSMNYLEELSQSHRRQMERQARSFNHTLAKLTETAESAEARDRKQQVRISQLERQLRELRNRLRPNALYHHHNHRHLHRHTFPRPVEPAVGLHSTPVTDSSDSASEEIPSPQSIQELWTYMTKDVIEAIGVSQWVLTVAVHLVLAIFLQLLIFYCIILPRLRRCISHLSYTSTKLSQSNGHVISSKQVDHWHQLPHGDGLNNGNNISQEKLHSRDSPKCPGVNSCFGNGSEISSMTVTSDDCVCSRSPLQRALLRSSVIVNGLWSPSHNKQHGIRVVTRTHSESALPHLSS